MQVFALRTHSHLEHWTSVTFSLFFHQAPEIKKNIRKFNGFAFEKVSHKNEPGKLGGSLGRTVVRISPTNVVTYAISVVDFIVSVELHCIGLLESLMSHH